MYGSILDTTMQEDMTKQSDACTRVGSQEFLTVTDAVGYERVVWTAQIPQVLRP